MPAHRRWWVGVVSLSFLAVAMAAEPQGLPGPERRGDYLHGHDFRMTPVVARDTSGQPITDMPAYRLGYRDTDGNWEELGPEPPVDIAIPDALRGKLMLVSTGSWALVPRGWKPVVAMLTGDSTLDLEFEAPGGPAQGWLREGMVVGAWTAMDEAAPFFPGLRKEMLDIDFAQPGQRFPLPHRVVSITRPDACTVVYDYLNRGSPTVHAWMNFVGMEDGELYTFEIAMPEADKAVRDVVFAQHTRPQAQCGNGRQHAAP